MSVRQDKVLDSYQEPDKNWSCYELYDKIEMVMMNVGDL
jgi:tryptophan 2,3-dioxygenase